MSTLRIAGLLALSFVCANSAFAAGDCSTPYTINSAGTISFNGVNQIGNPFSATAGADITIVTSALSACTGTMTLNAGTAISEDSASSLTAGTLKGSSVGSTSLLGTNNVNTLGQFFSNGDFDFTNSSALTVAGPVSAPSVYLSSSAIGTALSVTGAVTTGIANLTATTGLIDITSTAMVNGSAVELDGANGITAEVVLIAGTLSGSSTSGGARTTATFHRARGKVVVRPHLPFLPCEL